MHRQMVADTHAHMRGSHTALKSNRLTALASRKLLLRKLFSDRFARQFASATKEPITLPRAYIT
eukprot:5262603-Pleurochrysis_carterae.AAC.6